MNVRQIYADCYTGGGYSFDVRMEYSMSGQGTVIEQNSIGIIDAPVWLPAGACANINGTSYQQYAQR